MKPETDAAVRKMLITGYRHHTYALEDSMLRRFFNGESEVAEYLFALTGDLSYMLAPQRQRGVMNSTICMIAVVCRKAMALGADNEYCYALSDYYVYRVEETKNLDEIKKLTIDILEDFRELVQRSGTKNASPMILKALLYIEGRFYEPCKVSDVARHVGRNAGYLSSVFKKEMGICISDYIRRQRIAAAKKMLLDGVKVYEAAESLGYSSAAHFSREFTQSCGISPSRFTRAMASS